MNWSASVLTTVTSDTEPTIVVTFDSAKYIFNAGENTNRAFLQSRRNWKRTRGLFFTHVGTQRTSGLPGLLMSFADATISKLDIVGPPGLTHLLAAMRSYTFRDTMPVLPTEASWTPVTSSPPEPLYKDNNISVYAAPIIPSVQNENTLVNTDSDMHSVISSEIHLKRKRESSPDHPVKVKRTSTFIGGLEEESLSINNMTEHSSSPNELVGEDAQEWRRLMVKTMFPGSKDNNEKVDAEKRKARLVKEQAREANMQSRKRNKAANVVGSSKVQDQNEETPVGSASSETNLRVNATSESNPVESLSAEGSPDPPLANVDPYKRARIPTGFHQQLPNFIPSISAPRNNPSLGPTLAYVIVGPRVRGKFDVKKAEALGVPIGPLRGRLTKGQAITFKVKVGDAMIERVVQPEECVGETETPSVVLILDIPTPSHIPSLLSSFKDSPFYSKFRSNVPADMNDYAVRSIFHICGDGVMEDERYVEFMQGFGPLAHHVVSSREYGPDPITFTSAAFNQLRLNQLDTEIFPIPKFSLTPRRDMTVIPNIPAKTCYMSSNLLVTMRPPAPPSKETFADEGDLFHPAISSPVPVTLPPLTSERFLEAKANVEEYLRSGKVAKPCGADVGILPLGTGSAIPTKYRNVSSTLIQIPNWGNILLDAGEGTWGQLVRQFGLDRDSPSNIWQVLRDIKCIYISHIHGDHHMGLAQILAKRQMLDPPPTEPLYLVGIRAVHLYLRELSDLQDLGLNDPSGNGVITVMSEALHWKQTGSYYNSGMWQVGGNEPWTDYQESQNAEKSLCRTLGLESFRTVDVFHRTRCYGAVIKHTDGWSIVFSGDTQPTNTLVWAGKYATLLIHEATMADDQEEMAKRKAHSTFGQAITIGKKMNAENILLTHFSARYPKMPPSGVARPRPHEGSYRKEPVVALAFDHANLTLGNMWKVNYYLQAIQQSFRDTLEEGDDDVDVEATMEVDIT